jgi:hypothetical protein
MDLRAAGGRRIAIAKVFAETKHGRKPFNGLRDVIVDDVGQDSANRDGAVGQHEIVF